MPFLYNTIQYQPRSRIRVARASHRSFIGRRNRSALGQSTVTHTSQQRTAGWVRRSERCGGQCTVRSTVRRMGAHIRHHSARTPYALYTETIDEAVRGRSDLGVRHETSHSHRSRTFNTLLRCQVPHSLPCHCALNLTQQSHQGWRTEVHQNLPARARAGEQMYNNNVHSQARCVFFKRTRTTHTHDRFKQGTAIDKHTDATHGAWRG